MNSKQIIRALNALFQLDDEDRGLVLKLWNLSESDREAFVQALQVQPQGKATTKAGKKDTDVKKRNLEHCGVCDYTRRAAHHKDTSHKDYHEFQSGKPKSQRASSIQQQIQGRAKKAAVETGYCTYLAEVNGGQEMCEAGADNSIHDPLMGYAGYHEFQPAEQTEVADAAHS